MTDKDPHRYANGEAIGKAFFWGIVAVAVGMLVINAIWRIVT